MVVQRRIIGHARASQGGGPQPRSSARWAADLCHGRPATQAATALARVERGPLGLGPPARVQPRGPGRANCDAAARPLAVRMTRPSLSARRSMNPAFSASLIACSRSAPSRPMSRPTLSARRHECGALDAEAVKLGDERRCTLKTVSGDHPPMVPQRPRACASSDCANAALWQTARGRQAGLSSRHADACHRTLQRP